ncbi:hypothetical protein GOBAR_AA05059 [Gossypium barbadense]|uniref:Vacuolar protein sorting-associated protein 51 homolog n=1 Tax=Gossypium barbadense TaxID=3634 RepID=A0A2P5YIV9_GOSBA|nr:hypothetical protein GOBAR_AA05059 [Gossypium barbadense]
MGTEDVPLDDKAKRMRDLLSSFYSPDPSSTNDASSNHGSLDAIDTTSFDADQYMNLLIRKSNLEALLQRHVEMAAEIKNIDTDLQMLVYENYNKFISATDAIKRMKSNIVGMETNMEHLLDKIMSVQSKSDGVNTSLFEKREHIEKLHRTRNLLRKVQFIYDLPVRLEKCIKSEAYADAVKFYTGAMPIFKAYGDSSFQDCKQASEEAIAIIVKNLQGKLFSDSESIQARAEAAVLLKQLDFPVDSLQAKLLEKLEQSLGDLQLKPDEIENVSVESNDPKQGEVSDSIPIAAHEPFPSIPSNEKEAWGVGREGNCHLDGLMKNLLFSIISNQGSVLEFAEAIRAYRVIFPDSEGQPTKLAQDLVVNRGLLMLLLFEHVSQLELRLLCVHKKIDPWCHYCFINDGHFETTLLYVKGRISSGKLLGVLRK